MPTEARPGLTLELDELVAKREELLRRLRDGHQKIASARQLGRAAEAIAQAEEKWLKLLREYEAVEDRIRALKEGPNLTE